MPTETWTADRVASTAITLSVSSYELEQSLVHWDVNIVSSNQSQTTQSIKEVSVSHENNIQSLVEGYTESAYEGGITRALLNSKTSIQLGKDARKIEKAYHVFIRTMDFYERYNFSEYVRVEKSDEGVFSIVLAVSGSGRVYISELTDGWLSTKEALEELNTGTIPWIFYQKVGRQLVPMTAKGAIHTRVMERTAIQVGITSNGNVRTGHIADAIYYLRNMKETYKQDLLTEMRRASKAQEAAREAEKKKAVRSGTGNFENFFQTMMQKKTETTERLVEKFAIAPHGLRSSRNWGIEVETGGARGAVKPAGWDSRADGSLRSAYADGDRSADCREFVSPILHSFHSKGLESLTTHLATQPQNDTSGIHVHVDVEDLTPRQLGSLTYGYSAIEPLLASSYQREVRTYCQPRSLDAVRQTLRTSKTAATKHDVSRGDRYLSLNLNALSRHGTVEFRAMGPVYNYDYLIRWAYICRELVNVARSNVKQSDWNRVNTFEDLHKLFVKFGSETVDDSMSTITDEDIEAMFTKNEPINFSARMSELVLAGGEV